MKLSEATDLASKNLVATYVALGRAVPDTKYYQSSAYEACTGPLKEIAATAYHYTQGRRELNAIANLNNAVGTVSLPPALGI